ncbi:major facilitator superfamily domain-containing protein [Xylariales sp. PMI_506]|nr:major facilitator superfamily domain-containing protein [Xylariales sp. PMI_506]
MSDSVKVVGLPSGDAPSEGLCEDKEYQVASSGSPSTPQEYDVGPAAQEKAPGSDAPDGGAVAWLVVLGAWCTSFCSFGWVSSIGVFQEYYENELLSNYSASTISWIASMQIFLMMVMGPFVGAVYDHYGPRWLLLVGTFLHVFGIMMASLGTEYYQILLAQGLCSGIGASAVFQPAITCVVGWFHHKRGAAVGILFTGSSLGGVVFPILVTHLINGVGFGWAMRISAFLILALLIVANLTVRPYRPPTPHGITMAQLIKPLTEADFLFVSAGLFFVTFGYYVPINYISVQALSSGMNTDLVQYLIPLLNAGSLFGRLASGFLGDKVGRFNVFIIVCYLSAIWILALWLPDISNAGLLAFVILFGFFSGAYVSLVTPLIVQVSPLAEIGFRTGITFMFCAFSGLITNPINGAILDDNGGWTGVKIFSGVCFLVGTTFVLFARGRRTGWKPFVRF